MIPKLVFALDTTNVNQATELAKLAVRGGVDIIEAGTPLIKTYGVKIVKLLNELHPNIPVYADLKIMDFPEMELLEFFRANASMVSIMAFAKNYTILTASELTRLHNKIILCSTMGYPEPELKKRVIEISHFGVDYFIAHGSGSPQDAFDDLLNRINLIDIISDINLVVAGGINESNIDYILNFNPSMIIIGRGISSQEDVISTVARIKEKIADY